MTTYYISQAGNDSTGSGTSGAPWKTISKAFSSSAANDTIYCLGAGGTFTWVNQTFSSNRTVTGDGPTSSTPATFDGASSDPTWQVSSGSILTVSNLTFQNCSLTTGSSNHLIFLHNSGCNGSYTNCIFKNIIVMQNTSIYDGGLFGAGTFSTGNCSVALTACLIDNVICTGSPTIAPYFNCDLQGATVLTLTVTNCTFYSNVADNATCNFIATDIFGGTGITNATLKNNLIINANGINKAWGGLNGGSYGTSTNNDILGYSSVGSMTNTTSVDPLFVNPSGHNFNLRPTSPCIGAGVIV